MAWRQRGPGGLIKCRWRRSTPTLSTGHNLSPGCAATAPRNFSTTTGALIPELAALPPKDEQRMSANPHANGGLLLRDLVLPDFRQYAAPESRPGTTLSEATKALGMFLRDVIVANPSNFRVFGPDEVASNRLQAVFEVTDRQWDAETLATDDHLAPEGQGHGGALGAPVPGLARRLPADREARSFHKL